MLEGTKYWRLATGDWEELKTRNGSPCFFGTLELGSGNWAYSHFAIANPRIHPRSHAEHGNAFQGRLRLLYSGIKNIPLFVLL
ncbi:hypothetical protein SD81_009425 [Tolypothrix campylonemoides VB511288]|nr:hypothetical protein SD81_009425 [Tolypothrix campylonemoides VB511288]